MDANLQMGNRDNVYGRVLRQLELSANRRDVCSIRVNGGLLPASRIPAVRVPQVYGPAADCDGCKR